MENMYWPWRPFQQNEKYGYINRRSDIVVKPVWDDVLNGKTLSLLVYYSHHMLLPVKKGAKWGAVNENDQLILAPQWDSMGQFLECADGKQYVNVSIKQGQEIQIALIDETGHIVVGPLADVDMILPNGFIIFTQSFGEKSRCGIRNFKGEVVVACKYTAIEVCPTNLRKITLHQIDCDENCWETQRIELYSNYPNDEILQPNSKNVVIAYQY